MWLKISGDANVASRAYGIVANMVWRQGERRAQRGIAALTLRRSQGETPSSTLDLAFTEVVPGERNIRVRGWALRALVSRNVAYDEKVSAPQQVVADAAEPRLRY